MSQFWFKIELRLIHAEVKPEDWWKSNRYFEVKKIQFFHQVTPVIPLNFGKALNFSFEFKVTFRFENFFKSSFFWKIHCIHLAWFQQTLFVHHFSANWCQALDAFLWSCFTILKKPTSKLYACSHSSLLQRVKDSVKPFLHSSYFTTYVPLCVHIKLKTTLCRHQSNNPTMRSRL